MILKYDYDFLIQGSKYEKECEYYLYTIYCDYKNQDKLLLNLKLSCCHSLENFKSNAILNFKNIKINDNDEFLKNRTKIISMLLFLYN